MNQEISRPIAQAIVEIAVFLEFSGSDIIDPDAAVQALEQLAGTLQMVDHPSRRALSDQFKAIALEYTGERAKFVESLGDALGLSAD
jgi:hypothetical protein